MKKSLRTLWLGAVALCAAGIVTSCNDDDPAPAPYEPKIAISDVTATGSSVTFTLTPSDAVRYTYAVAPKGETADPKAVESDKASTQQVQGLEADKAYTITAVAYAEDGTESNAATHDFTTNPKATVMIGSEIEVTFFSAKLTLTPTNATSVSYAYYPAQARPEAPEWTKVEGNEPIDVTLDKLAADTDYLLVAYATNGDGDGEEVKSRVFRTDAAPAVEIGEVTTTATTAAFTLTPSHATGMKYTHYPQGQHPGEPQWTDLAQSDAADVELTGLEPATAYVVEALAYTTAGEGEAVVSASFTTAELPALSIKTAATSAAIWARFEINPAKTPAYYFSDPIDVNDGWATYTTAEGFLSDIATNDWAYQLQTAPYEIVATATYSTEYKIFAVCADAEGVVDASSVQEVTVTTPAMDRTGSGKATVEISDIAPKAISLEANLRFSDDCVMYVAGAVEKSEADGAGGINGYVNMNFMNWTANSAAQLQNPFVVNGLMPETDYYLYALAIDGEGKFGAIVSQQTRTEAIAYDPNTTVTFSIHETGFTSMTLQADIQGAASVRYRNMLQSEFQDMYNGEAHAVYTELYDQFADQIFLDENNRFMVEWLEYDSPYILFALPVKEDGSFGTPVQFDYRTGKYAAAGTAQVTFEDVTANSTTITPGADCVKFVWAEVGQEVYDLYSRKIGEYVMSTGNYTTIDPAVATPVELFLFGEDSYLVVIACDAQGQWSAPSIHHFPLPATN